MEEGKISFSVILAALVGVLLIGIGVAFNNCTGLGNDSVGIVYDGIRVFFGLSQSQLGWASNAVNGGILVLLFFTGRKYVSIGTLVYFVPYGTCINIGNKLYEILANGEGAATQTAFSAAGCFLLYLGVAMFITMDIGVDPFTGVVLLLAEKTKKEFRIVKMIFDFAMIILGWSLGGKAGMVTIITALTAGPCIQYFAGILRKII
ncbi:MAG: YitT family protein [Lachnospiraceae bacterium]